VLARTPIRKRRTRAEKLRSARVKKWKQPLATATPEKPVIHYYRDGRQRINTKCKEGKLLYRSRTLDMADRQKWLCGICEGFMCTYDVTFDHVNLRGKFRDDRILDESGNWLNRAVHAVCNVERGSKRVARGEVSQ
jgi:hypothetical protein